MTIRTMLPFLTVIALACSLSGCSRNSDVVRQADELERRALREYVDGSFESATNALLTYSAYLNANEKQIAPFKIIPVTQFVLHSMLACMMIYAENTNAALYHLSRAYPYHVQLWAQKQPVPKADFVQFLLEGRGKIDAKTGAEWRRGFSLDTNFVAEISASWIQQPQ